MPDGKGHELRFALAINVTVMQCNLDRDVRLLSLEYDGQPSVRIEFSSVPLTSTLFFALTPVPYHGYPDPILRFRGLDLGGSEKYTATLTLQMLMCPQGFRDAQLFLKGNGTYLDDPLSLIDPKRTLGMGKLKHRAGIPLDSILHYARIDITVPPVNVQCMGISKALKVFAVMHTPEKLIASYIERPRIYHPNRRLRRAIQFAQEKKNGSLPGKMSLLQACSIKPVNVMSPRTIELGAAAAKEKDENPDHVEIDIDALFNDLTPSETVDVDKVVAVATNASGAGGSSITTKENNAPASNAASRSRKRKGVGLLRSRSFESAISSLTKKANERLRALQNDVQAAKKEVKMPRGAKEA